MLKVTHTRREVKIPKGWIIVKLDNVGNIMGGGTPDSTNSQYWNGDILWAVPTDITKLSTIYIHDTERKVTEKGLKNSSAKLLPSGTILITTRATIGECAITTKPMATNQGFQNIICNNNFDRLYVFYVIMHNSNRLLRLAYGTTFLEISKSAIKNIKIEIPKQKKEQIKIASILSRVDATIEKTQQKIDKLERLKKGLMQQLLTRGIGHTKFRKVKWLFGKEIEIPRKWKFLKFSVVVQTNPPTKIQNSIVPYIPMDAVDTTKSHFNYFIERKLADFSSLPKFQENDVLFASITPSTENGKTCIVENFSKKGLGSSELTVLRATVEVFPKYLYYYLKSHRIRQYAISQMMGTTGRQRVPDSVFKKDLFFELPSIVEQTKIASILSGVDAVYSLFSYIKTRTMQIIFLRLWRVTTS